MRANWGDREAHKAYHGLSLGSPGAVVAIPPMNAVGPDGGFIVASFAPGGSPTTNLVEVRPVPLDARLGEVAPTSPVATRAAGLRADDQVRVRVNDDPAADEVAILEVGHKHLRLGRRSLAEFVSLFPDDQTFFGFTMDPENPDKAVEKTREETARSRLRRRGTALTPRNQRRQDIDIKNTFPK